MLEERPSGRLTTQREGTAAPHDPLSPIFAKHLVCAPDWNWHSGELARCEPAAISGWFPLADARWRGRGTLGEVGHADA